MKIRVMGQEHEIRTVNFIMGCDSVVVVYSDAETQTDRWIQMSLGQFQGMVAYSGQSLFKMGDV